MVHHSIKAVALLAALTAFGATQALATGYYHPPKCIDCQPAALPDCYWTVDFKVSYRGDDYFGKIFYVDDALKGTGYELLAVDPTRLFGHDITKPGLLGVEFDFKGETFTQCDDILYDAAPVIKFAHGEFVGLQFAFKDDGDLFSITFDKFYKDFDKKGYVYYEAPVYNCEVIPTPAAASAGLSLLAALAFRRRRAA